MAKQIITSAFEGLDLALGPHRGFVSGRIMTNDLWHSPLEREAEVQKRPSERDGNNEESFSSRHPWFVPSDTL